MDFYLKEPKILDCVFDKHPSILFMQDESNNTFLHLAFKNKLEIDIQWMIEKGLSPYVLNQDNETPFHVWLTQVVELEREIINSTEKEKIVLHREIFQKQFLKFKKWCQIISMDQDWWDAEVTSYSTPKIDWGDKFEDHNLNLKLSMMKLKKDIMNEELNKKINDFNLMIAKIKLFETPEVLEWALENGLTGYTHDSNGNTLFHSLAQELLFYLI